MVKATKRERAFLSRAGKLGGEVVKKKTIEDPDYYRRIGQKGLKSRWKKPPATSNA